MTDSGIANVEEDLMEQVMDLVELTRDQLQTAIDLAMPLEGLSVAVIVTSEDGDLQALARDERTPLDHLTQGIARARSIELELAAN